jgi:hypothetical protein
MRVWRCLMYGLILQMLVMGIGLAEEGSEEGRRDTGQLPPLTAHPPTTAVPTCSQTTN